MYADGLIGNKAVIETLGALTAGIYNYMRAEGQKPYTLKDIINSAYGYIYEDIENDPSDSCSSG